MLFWRRRSIIALVISLFIIILAVNVYFVYTVVEEWNEAEEQGRDLQITTCYSDQKGTQKSGLSSYTGFMSDSFLEEFSLLSVYTLLAKYGDYLPEGFMIFCIVQLHYVSSSSVHVQASVKKRFFPCLYTDLPPTQVIFGTFGVKMRKPVVKERLVSGRNKGRGKFYVSQGENELLATVNAVKKIRKIAEEIFPLHRNMSKGYKYIVKNVISDLGRKANTQVNLWKIAEQWVTGTQVLPERAPLLGSVLDTLCSSKIVKADNSKRGTQLKLLLTLEGGQQALFKPQWYPRDEIISGAVYAGRDRHNAEVAAFHLSLLLNLRRVPLTVGRKVNLRREVMPVASAELLNTFYQEGNNTCFYGVCVYCEPKSPVCANGNVMEGALIMWLPSRIRFQRHPHPWRRSYKDVLIARWEVEEDYCEEVKTKEQYDVDSSPRLLDIIDGVVFDFLLGNGDRHHYEVPSDLKPSSVFLFDNGKGFGNPNVDHLDILAPLYQCCIIRKKTLERLKTFAGGALGPSLEETLKYSHIYPVLTDSHLNALDRRLILILAAVELCVRENGVSKVLL